MNTRPLGLGAHWQAPTVIILAFSAGLAFAVGHHLFYTFLDQMPVDHNLFNQQTNIAIGTAFAFLFRASLVIATCTAYWQVFWGTALRNTLTISSVDALTGVLGSLSDFARVRAFFSNPGLAVLALLAWTVPFASLLPPATLSVIPAETTNSTYAHVSVPSFANGMMVASNFRLLAGDSFNGLPGGLNSSRLDIYVKPTLPLSRLATTTAYRGAIPDHQTSLPNSTYDVEFNAPALQCRAISQDIMTRFDKAAGCNFFEISSLRPPPDNPCSQDVTYVSWVPDRLSLVPFDNDTIRNGFLPLDADLEDTESIKTYSKSYMGRFGDGPASMFVATRSHAPPFTQGWDVLNCSLFNATYVVHESSDSNGRSLPVLSHVHLLNSVPFLEETDVFDISRSPSAEDAATFGYTALMESLNRLLVGSIAGSAQVTDTPYWMEVWLRVQNPTLMSTLLAFSAELAPFLSRIRRIESEAPPDDSQWTIVQEIDATIVSIPNEALESPHFNRSLGSSIEELFQNMTLSLFSDARFLHDSDQAVNVTTSSIRNLYEYSQRNLLLSYGVALSLTLLASIAGCAAIAYNGASYTNKFSTILRTTTGLEDLVSEKDRTGADPLPKYLSKARVDLGRGREASGELQSVPRVAGEQSFMIDHDRESRKAPGAVSQRSVSPM